MRSIIKFQFQISKVFLILFIIISPKYKKRIVISINLPSTAITAGHCICGERVKVENEPDMACINDSPDGTPQNQRSRKNRIYVHAGTKDMSKESSLFDEKGVQMFSMHKAFAKWDPRFPFSYDIGMLRSPYIKGTKTRKSFYSSANQLIAPICLGSDRVKNQFDDCHLTTVGWGLLYNAQPEGPWDVDLTQG